jgi:hypothetical protein
MNPVMLTGGDAGGLIIDDESWDVDTEKTIMHDGRQLVYRRISDDNDPLTPDQAVFVQEIK